MFITTIIITTDMKMKHSIGKKLSAISIIFGIAFPTALFFTIVLPTQTQYNRQFGGHVIIAYDQSTLSGMKQEILLLWKQMNQSFLGDHAQIYNSAFYWEQTYDNSLQAEDRYFTQTINRLDNYNAQYETFIKAGTNIVLGVPLTDWYDKIVQNMRIELAREGGLDWAIRGAYYLKYSPLTWWFPAIIILDILTISLALAFIVWRVTRKSS